MAAFYRILLAVVIFAPVAMAPGPSRAQLTPDPIPNVVRLPEDYPARWIFVHDLNFDTLLAGKVVIVDPGDETYHVKGTIGAGQAASFAESRTRPELYVTETFHSRGIDGERTDVFTIYDKASLKKTGEIILPGGKRAQFVTQRSSFQLTRNDKFALVFNFTPATSVTIIDLDARKILNEIALPGCSLLYPTGDQGFSTLCGNGSLATFQLNDDGIVAGRTTSAVFNDIDDDAMFMKTADIAGVTYFPTFTGNIRPIDTSGENAVVMDAWPLVSEAERAENWRPGGWQIIASNGSDRLYVLMHKDGKEGSHKGGGSEVWVFDNQSHQRVDRIVLKNWGITIEVTPTSPSYLVVVNGEMELDIYDAATGNWLRLIGGGLAATPFALFSVK